MNSSKPKSEETHSTLKIKENFRPQSSKFIDWLPKFSLRVPRSNSFHVPKELRSSDENVNVS